MPELRFPETVRELLARRYRNQHRNWLAGEGGWPIQVSLGCPTEEQAHVLAAGLPQWVDAWRTWTAPGTVEWCERRWRSLGAQRLPERLVVASADDVAILAGEDRRWTQASLHYRRLVERWPLLSARLGRWFDALASFDSRDVAGLEALLSWIEVHPSSNLFARQLPIPGMDTKWLEPRLPMVGELVGALRGEDGAGASDYERCGLRTAPSTIRVRILDAGLRQRVGGLGDVTAPIEDLCALDLPVERVFIVENLQTGLAFEDRRGAAVVVGLGYGVSMLGRIPWIADARCTYWGDVDTHGFAILSRARSCLRSVETVLMDEATLLRYRDLWALEMSQCSAAELPLLKEAERSVYRGLKEQRWGTNVRLEQERIAWDEASAALG